MSVRKVNEMKNTIGILLIVLALVSSSSCIPELVPPEALLDTPSRHVENGMKFLRSGKLEAPFLEFKRALELDEEYAPAHVGVGLIHGLNGNFAEAMEWMSLADLYARDRLESVMVHVGYMRLYLMGREKISENWLKKIKERYDRAVFLAPESPDAYFYMGLAYKETGRFEEASQLFLTVVQMNRDYVQEASEQYAIIRNLELDSPS